MSSRSDLVKMGKHIQEIRKSKKYTQKDLGKIIDVNHKTISKWEQGNIAPDITVLKSLADALDIELDELLCGEKVRANDKSKREDITINAIDLYTKNTKRRLSKIFIVIIAILFFVAGTIYIVDKYYRWDVKEISSDGDFRVHGYIVSNRKETKYIFDKIDYRAEENGTDYSVIVTKINIKLVSNDKSIELFDRSYKEDVKLWSVFKNIVVLYEGDLGRNNISLIIDYIDKNDEEHLVNIKMR